MHKIWRSEWVQLIASLILVPVLIWALFFLAPVLVKVAGTPFLFIPSTLGVIQRASPDEVITIPTNGYNATFFLSRAGAYAVYADDVFWQQDADSGDVRQSALVPGRQWLKIQYVETNTDIRVVPVTRGLRPYDELVARGRPMFTFQAPGPGWYRVVYLYTPPTYVAILPDYVTGNEDLLTTLIIGQLALLLAYPIGRRIQKWRVRRQERRRKREEADRIWQTIRRDMGER